MEGTQYPVVVGNSLLHEESEDYFHTFKYDFRPPSIDTTVPGIVSTTSSKTVQLNLKSKSTGKGVVFSGRRVEPKETDCLLIFDGEKFRLEALGGSTTQLRHLRESKS